MPVAICPKCHQSINTERLGVRLPPLKARIVDTIKRAGDIGITSEELHNEIYRGYIRLRAPSAMRTHIWQINDMLEATDWRIVADPRGRFARWYLRKVVVREAAE